MKHTLSLSLAATGAALITVLAQISIPIGPVPITLQTLALGLVVTLLKRREALLSVSLYLILGAIGLPVFAGFSGGFHILVGPTAGYLWAYLLYAFVTSSLTSEKTSLLTIFLANFLGDALVFLGGVLGLTLLAGMDLSKAIAVGLTPFILGDLIKILLITILSRPIFQSLHQHSYYKS